MNFIACQRHPVKNIQFLYLLPEETEFLCENCMEDDIIINGELIKINKLISLETLFNKPEMICRKLDFSTNELNSIYRNICDPNYSSLNIQIQEMEKKPKYYNNRFWKCYRNLKLNIETFKKQFQKDQMKGFNFEPLKQLLKSLVKSDDTTNPDAINQLKLKLHQYFQQLQKDNGQEANNVIFTKIYETSNKVEQEIQKLETLVQLKANLEQFHNDQYKIAISIYPQVTKQIQSTLFSSYQQYKVINLVKERQKLKIQDIKLIYLGSRDGLNAQSFWSKANGKKNLLMIFKSKSNYIFGAYSPCQWQQNLGNYVQDNTNSSFLFSQTHDEIYPIVKNQYAICCNSGYGPVFGGEHDLCIEADFQNGGSALGHSYQQGSKFPNQYKTQLFGQATPNVIECEIFEIIF